MAARIFEIHSKRQQKEGGQILRSYVTYDLDQTGSGRSPMIYRGAKEIKVDGEIVSWEIGEFNVNGVEKEPGVRIAFRSPGERDSREEVIVLSKYAQNVRVRVGNLPREYQNGLDSAA